MKALKFVLCFVMFFAIISCGGPGGPDPGTDTTECKNGKFDNNGNCVVAEDAKDMSSSEDISESDTYTEPDENVDKKQSPEQKDALAEFTGS